MEKSSTPSMLEQDQIQTLFQSEVMSLFKNEPTTIIPVYWWIMFIRSIKKRYYYSRTKTSWQLWAGHKKWAVAKSLICTDIKC